MTLGPARGGRTLAGLAGLFGAALLAACGAAPRADIRLLSDNYAFTVNADPSPPHAREPILYTVTVLDRKTRQLIEGGEGRIFASSIDRVNKWDSFVPGREAGTYTARLFYT